MRTDRQSEASRNNGAKSHGPTSEEGKAKSSQNSVRHNLSGGHIVLLSNESPEEFKAHSYGYLDRFAPADHVERDLVNQMIAASWRLARISAMECSLVEIEMDRQRATHDQEFSFLDSHARMTLSFFGNVDQAEAGAMLQRYQSAARRAYATALRMLKELQGDRFGRQPAIAPSPQDKPVGRQSPQQSPQHGPHRPGAENAQPRLIAFTRHPVQIVELQNEPEPSPVKIALCA